MNVTKDRLHARSSHVLTLAVLAKVSAARTRKPPLTNLIRISNSSPSLRGAKRRSNPDLFHGDTLDCFASLAMTKVGARSHSRGMICPGLAKPPPPKAERAQGKPGAQHTRSLVCGEKSTRVSHHGSAETRRPSLRNGLRLMLVLSPVSVTS